MLVDIMAPSLFSSILRQVSACTLPTIRALALVLWTATTAPAQDRMPPVAPDKYDDAQKKAAEEFQAKRKEPSSDHLWCSSAARSS